MARKIPTVLSITGKSEDEAIRFSELLTSLLKPKHGSCIVSRIGMDAILTRWGMNQACELGDKLRLAHNALIENGTPIPDELMIETFMAWSAELQYLNLQVLLLTGAPECVLGKLSDACEQVMTIEVDFGKDHPASSLQRILREMGGYSHPLAKTGLHRLDEPTHHVNTAIEEMASQFSFPSVAA